MRKSKLVAIAAVAASLSLALAGCGSSSSTGSSASGTTSVTIGIGAPLTDGVVAMGKGIVRGVNLAVEQANASQDVKDLKLEIKTIEGDDKGDPTTGGNVATQFASNPSIVGVVGHLNSGVSRVAVKIYNPANIVQISPANTAADLTQMGMKNYFRTCTIDPVQGPAAADYALKKLNAKVAYVIDDSTPYGEGLASAWADGFAKGGGTVAGKEKTSDKDTDFKALVATIKSKNVDVVYYGGVYNSGALLSKQLKEGGVTAAFMGGDGIYDPEFIKIATAANAKGNYATNVGLPVDQLPKAQEFTKAYKAKYPNDEIGAYDANAYDAANAIIKAIVAQAKAKGASSLTTTDGKKGIIDAVAKSDFDGVTGKVSFDANGDTNNKAITMYTVDDSGKWVVAPK